MLDRTTVMSWLEGLAQDDWRMFHSDSEVQEIAKVALALLKEQQETIKRLQDKLFANPDAWIHCKDCKHRPKEPNFETYESGFDLEFPEGSKCPCRCGGDEWYSWYPEDDWFCANGER